MFEEKLEREYQEKGLFPFLAKHSTGNFPNIAVKRTEPIYLKELDYVKKHPESDLENIYVKEIINLVMQEELKASLSVLELLKIDLSDDEKNILFTKSKERYKNATTFYCPVKEDICIAKNSLHVDDMDLTLGNYKDVDLPTYGECILTAFVWWSIDEGKK